MWLLGLANPLNYPGESLLTVLGMVAATVLGWLTKQGYDWWDKARKDRIKNQELEDENENKRKLAELAIKERENEIRMKQERGEFDLESLRDDKVIKSYEYLLEKERMEKDALRVEHKEELAAVVAEMRQMREEHKREIATEREARERSDAITRAEHEQCLQDKATALARIEALEARVKTVETRYENLKQRVGGSNFILGTEIVPEKPEKKKGDRYPPEKK